MNLTPKPLKDSDSMFRPGIRVFGFAPDHASKQAAPKVTKTPMPGQEPTKLDLP
jgi:hypothetical protein